MSFDNEVVVSFCKETGEKLACTVPWMLLKCGQVILQNLDREAFLEYSDEKKCAELKEILNNGPLADREFPLDAFELSQFATVFCDCLSHAGEPLLDFGLCQQLVLLVSTNTDLVMLFENMGGALFSYEMAQTSSSTAPATHNPFFHVGELRKAQMKEHFGKHCQMVELTFYAMSTKISQLEDSKKGKLYYLLNVLHEAAKSQDKTGYLETVYHRFQDILFTSAGQKLYEISAGCMYSEEYILSTIFIMLVYSVGIVVPVLDSLHKGFDPDAEKLAVLLEKLRMQPKRKINFKMGTPMVQRLALPPAKSAFLVKR